MNQEDVVYMYAVEYYSAVKSNKLMLFVVTQMEVGRNYASGRRQKKKINIGVTCRIQRNQKVRQGQTLKADHRSETSKRGQRWGEVKTGKKKVRECGGSKWEWEPSGTLLAFYWWVQ